MATMCEVSRTTVRAALEELEQTKVIKRAGSIRVLHRKIMEADFLEERDALLPKDQEVLRHLIEKVTSGAIRPGQRISERTVAQELGCSIAPVREGFLALTPLGLFQKEARHQWEAVALDGQRASDLMELRWVIEGYCLRKMFKTGWHRQHRAKLEQLTRQTKRIVQAKKFNTRSFLSVDQKFHDLLLHSCGNDLLIERNRFIHALIQFQLDNPRYSGDRARLGLREHLRILEAMLNGNQQEAEAALQQHMDTAVETLTQMNRPGEDHA